jgi:hypothetical protein
VTHLLLIRHVRGCDATTQKRVDMDKMDLQLQSLVYEKAHLVKEIAANRDFVYVRVSCGVCRRMCR